MNRLVYLFELDSVRNSESEIEIGQQILFKEIVLNGNSVVLSFNQLTDSEVFLNLIKNKKSYPHVIRLFELGAIKISRFGDCRTASQYIQDAIAKCKDNSDSTFLFSGLPVCSTEIELLQYIENALRYNDLAGLRELLQKKKAEYEKIKAYGSERDLEKIDKECERLEFIIRYVNMILILSIERLADNPPKEETSKKFTTFINEILERYDEDLKVSKEIMEKEDFVKNLHEAISVLKIVRDSLSQGKESDKYIQNRSNWLPEIYKQGKQENTFMANAIIDLCYNYTIEDSIKNVSKHYKDNDFMMVFINQLYDYWKSYLEFIHIFPTEDGREQKRYVEVNIPWDTAVRLVEGIKSKKLKKNVDDFLYEVLESDTERNKNVPLYEDNYSKERKLWNKKIIWNMIKRFFFAVDYIILFCIVQFIMGELEAVVPHTCLLDGILYDIFTIILFGILGSVISELTHLPDILESLRDIYIGFLDCFCIIKTTKNRENKNNSIGE